MENRVRNAIHLGAHGGTVHCGNINAVSNSIYSYQLLIGRKIAGTWFIHDSQNSVTTEKHKSYLRQAVQGQDSLLCAEVPESAGDFQTHKRNLKGYALDYEIATEKAAKARQRKLTYIEAANEAARRLERYVALFGCEGLEIPVLPILAAPTLNQEQIDKAAAKAVMAKQKREANQAANLAAWLDHAPLLPRPHGLPADYAYFRPVEKGDSRSRGFQSTLGVSISWPKARGVYDQIARGDKFSMAAGTYHVREISDTEIVIGCHRILRSHWEEVAQASGFHEQPALPA